jgi:hypothetical protein
MAGLLRLRQCEWFVVLILLLLSLPTQACPFCKQGQTWMGETKLANMVLFGTLTNASSDPREGAPDGTTDMVIEMVVKNHDFLDKRKVMTLPRYIPPFQDGNKYQFLVFFNVIKNKLDPYRGVPIKADFDTAAYLKGALTVQDEKPQKRLAYFFNFLENPAGEISADAYQEFGNADYKDYKDLARTLPADRIAGWLSDRKTPTFRYGLYASLLGHCGSDKHAALLREMLDDPDRQFALGIDGVMAGYIMLKPKEGTDYLKSVLANPRKGFQHRYTALKVARFFWEYRSDVISHEELTEIMTPLLHMKDIADMAIEEFRKWRHFEIMDRILALQNDPVYNSTMVQRSILRYALSGKGNQAADQFVALQRRMDPKGVADLEEMLKSDKVPSQASPLGTSFKGFNE